MFSLKLLRNTTVRQVLFKSKNTGVKKGGVDVSIALITRQNAFRYQGLMQVLPTWSYNSNNFFLSRSILWIAIFILMQQNSSIAFSEENAESWCKKGDAFDDTGKPQEALKAYSEALRIKPRHLYALINKGAILSDLGQHQEALTLFDDALKIEPKNIHAMINKTRVLRKLEYYSEALEIFAQILEIDNKNIHALYNKSVTLDALGRYDEALLTDDETLQIYPNEVNVLCKKGTLLSRLGRQTEALDMFNKALSIDPRHIDALTNIGNVLSQLERYQDALKFLNKALKINPNEISALMNKGFALMGLNNYKEAMDVYNRILKIYPNHIDALAQTGNIFSYQKNYKKALKIFDQVLLLDPKHVHTLHNKALILLNLEKLEEALEIINKILTINHDDTDALIFQKLIQIKLGRINDKQIPKHFFDPLSSRICTRWLEASMSEREAKYDQAIKMYEAILDEIKDKHDQSVLTWVKRAATHNLALVKKIKSDRKETDHRNEHQSKRLKIIRSLQLDQQPTHYEYALLSKTVYDNEGGRDFRNWKKLCYHSCEKTGYFGAAYKNKITGAIVITHRGTQLSNLDAVFNDVLLIQGKIPEQLQSALEFSKFVYTTEKIIDKRKVSHTGHSLGAALAELCAWKHELSAVTFDSPGVKKHISCELGQAFDPYNVNIIGYLSEPNLINTLGGHIGIRLRIYPRRELLSLFPRDTIWLRLEPAIGEKNVGRIRALVDWYIYFREKFDPKYKKNYEKFESNLSKITTELSKIANLESHEMTLIKAIFDERTHMPLLKPFTIIGWPSSSIELGTFTSLCEQMDSPLRDPVLEDIFLDEKMRYQFALTGYLTEKEDIQKIRLNTFNKKSRNFLKLNQNTNLSLMFYIGAVIQSFLKCQHEEVIHPPKIILDNMSTLSKYRIINENNEDWVILDEDIGITIQDFRNCIMMNFPENEDIIMESLSNTKFSSQFFLENKKSVLNSNAKEQKFRIK